MKDTCVLIMAQKDRGVDDELGLWFFHVFTGEFASAGGDVTTALFPVSVDSTFQLLLMEHFRICNYVHGKHSDKLTKADR